MTKFGFARCKVWLRRHFGDLMIGIPHRVLPSCALGCFTDVLLLELPALDLETLGEAAQVVHEEFDRAQQKALAAPTQPRDGLETGEWHLRHVCILLDLFLWFLFPFVWKRFSLDASPPVFFAACGKFH